MSNGTALQEEWAEARKMLGYFDEKLHDLRKYGFTLITGLLAIQGLLLPSIQVGPEIVNTVEYNATHVLVKNETRTTNGGAPDLTKSGFAYPVKIAILAVTLVLVLALRWLDGNYQGLQRGAAIRAKVIERFINFELSDSISVRYEVERLGGQIRILYYFFEVAIIALAVFLLLPYIFDNNATWNDSKSLNVALVVLLTSSAIGEGVFYFFFISPEKRRGYVPTEWAIDRVECKRGDKVRIMTTNIKGETWKGGNYRHLHQGQQIWEIYDSKMAPQFPQDDNHPGRMASGVDLKPGQSYMWAVEMNLPPGVYHLCVDMDDDGKKILKKAELDKQGKYFWQKYKMEEEAKHGAECVVCKGRLLDRRILVVP